MKTTLHKPLLAGGIRCHVIGTFDYSAIRDLRTFLSLADWPKGIVGKLTEFKGDHLMGRVISRLAGDCFVNLQSVFMCLRMTETVLEKYYSFVKTSPPLQPQFLYNESI